METQNERVADGAGLGARVEIRGLNKNFGSTKAVDNFSLTIEAGEFVSVLGPSGSGKTTVLMAIAGFQQPTGGEILVAGQDVLPLPANKRNIGMVFQKYALFPHMTVCKNIAFPLEMRGFSRSQIESAVNDALTTVRLEEYADRMPLQLSGGQQQRVALARAIVFEPPLLLMDEPLGALDKKLREELQIEIKRLQKRLGITVLFVTHDQSEALAMSDRVAVMDKGKLQQVGRPRELYQNPSSVFVADFMGDSNLLRGQFLGAVELSGLGAIDHNGKSLQGRTEGGPEKTSTGQNAVLMIRPEQVELTKLGSEASAELTGTVTEIVFAGATNTYLVQIGSEEIRAALPASKVSGVNEITKGETVGVSWEADEAIIFTQTDHSTVV